MAKIKVPLVRVIGLVEPVAVAANVKSAFMVAVFVGPVPLFKVMEFRSISVFSVIDASADPFNSRSTVVFPSTKSKLELVPGLITLP